MMRMGSQAARGVALAALVGGAAGCESSAPASTAPMDRVARSAQDWAGTLVPRAAAAPPAAMAHPLSPERGTWVLHVGDSFVHAALQQTLRPLFEGTKTGYVVSATTATYTTTWAYGGELDKWLARSPALVLVTLGANEVEMPVPAEHAGAVEVIARKIVEAHAACVWITPPMWKKDTGILQVIHDHSAPCLFFDSDAVLGGLGADERQHDRIHPSDKGGARWANALWGWLLDHRDPESSGWALVPYETSPGR
jgi:hypothetical protein